MKKRAGKPPQTLAGKSKSTNPANRLPANVSGNPQTSGAVWMVCLILAALTFGVFGRTTGYDFVNFDDDVYVYHNPDVSGGVTLGGLSLAFTRGSQANWDPLTTISHMVDCQFYGLRAGGHHLTNVLLHAISVILLFLVLRQMTGAFWRSALVAAVFAIHPLHVESVAWVSERKDTLSGVFFLLTLCAYVRYARHPGWLAYLLVALFFILGLMSKAMLVTVPFLLLLLDWWPLERFKPAVPGGAGAARWFNQVPAPQRLILEKLPFLTLSLGSCFAAAAAQSHGKSIQSLTKYSFILRLGNALNSVWEYILQMFHPAGLAAFYPYPVHNLPVWELLLFAVALGAVSVGAFLWRRQRPYVLAGWLWYLGMLVPVIGLVQLGAQARADRYTYLPQIGLYVALVWLAESVLLPRWIHRRVVFAGAAALIVAGLAAVSVRQVSYWRNSETLWQRDINVTSDNFLAHYDLGKFLEKNEPARALEQYQEALRINPDDGDTLQNLGDVLDQLGHHDEALQVLQRAVVIQPDDAKAHYNLGNVLARAGRLDEAIAQLERAADLDPGDKMAHNNLGDALYQRGRVEEAIAEIEKAVKLPPDEPQVRCNLGLVLRQQGRIKEAAQQFEQALAVQPDLDLARSNLRDIAWLLATSPDAAMRDGTRALELARELAALPGGETSANLAALAAAEAECGQYGPAAATAQRALDLAGAQAGPDVLANLRKQLARYQAGKPLRETDQNTTSSPANGP